MIYDPLEKKDTEYQGESYSSTLNRSTGAWGIEDTGYFEMLDKDGAVKSTGPTGKTPDNMGITFHVPDTDTPTLEGKYRLLIHLTNSVDATINDIIADYTIIHNVRPA